MKLTMNKDDAFNLIVVCDNLSFIEIINSEVVTNFIDITYASVG